MTTLSRTLAAISGAALLSLLWLRAGAEEPLNISAKTQQRLGLRVQTLKAATLQTLASGTATVLDPVPFIHLDTELQAAEATALASRQERDRLRSLQGDDSQVSVKALEAAQAQASVDAARANGVRTELAVSWGNALPRMNPVQRHELVESLAHGTSALLRVDALQEPALADAHGTPRMIMVTSPVTGKQLQTQSLGWWPQAGDNLSGNAWLVRVNAQGFAVGSYTAASVASGTRAEGVLIPAAAVVRWNALQWVFVMTDATHFERRPIAGAAERPEGWLASRDFKDGEQVVVDGAATLLSVQTLDVD